MGRADSYSQIAMPWDADQTFFRRDQDSSFAPRVEVVHKGSIKTFTTQIQSALNLKALLASPALTGTINW